MDWLLDVQNFMTRSHCGLGWSPQLIFVYKLANFLIATAYFLIPLNLMVFWKKRREITPNPWIILLFASFISLCGMTHVADIVVFHFPMYRLFTALLMLTGLVSILTAILLPGVISRFLDLTSSNFNKLSNENEKLVRENVNLEQIVILLTNQNNLLESYINSREEKK